MVSAAFLPLILNCEWCCLFVNIFFRDEGTDFLMYLQNLKIFDISVKVKEILREYYHETFHLVQREYQKVDSGKT
jgi:hypothetical protein